MSVHMGRYKKIAAGLAVAVVLVVIAFKDGGIAGLNAIEPATGNSVAAKLAPHKALYDFKLVSVQPAVGLAGVNGQMFFKWDDVCDAWTTDHRFSVTYNYIEQLPLQVASHYVSWESKEQDVLHFTSERKENGVVTEQLKGSARRNADGTGSADYTKPEALHFALPDGFMLPSGHTFETIRQALRDNKMFNAVMFDGTDTEGPVEISSFITEPVATKEIMDRLPDDAQVDKDLLGGKAWRVRMAVYPLEDREATEPAYEMEVVLHENGIVSHILIDYRSFTVEQDLQALEKLPENKC